MLLTGSTLKVHEMRLTAISACDVIRCNLHHVLNALTMRPIAENTARLSVSLPKADYDALQHVAGKNDVSVAWLVRKAIERFLESSPQGALFASAEVGEIPRK